MSRSIEALNKKIEGLLKVQSDDQETLTQRTREFNDLKIKNSFLESTLSEKEKNIISIEDSRRILQAELKDALRMANDYQRKYEKVNLKNYPNRPRWS
jgi:hypothetical protein